VSATKPKHHYAMHVVQVLRQFGLLQCAFVCERKHKQFKRAALDVTGGDGFEDAVLQQLLLKAQNAKVLQLGEVLYNEKQHGAEFRGTRASYHGNHVAAGDFVSYWGGDSVRVGVVRGFTRAAGDTTIHVCVTAYGLIYGHTDIYERLPDHEPIFVELRYVIASCIWKTAEDDGRRVYHVLRPGQLEWMQSST
jgi:hypothetical protein